MASVTLASQAGKAVSATDDLLDLIYESDLNHSIAFMSFSRDLFARARRSNDRLHHLHNNILLTLDR
jgi:hypothetical protein